VYLSAQSSNISTPFIQNYPKEQYGAGTRNWDFVQDEQGIIYIANNEGLLQFNGQNWNLFPLPNKTILRALSLGKKGKIYVGGQDEMGYFAPDEKGSLKFTSLKYLIPEKYRHFEDVWEIEQNEDGIFFRASDRVYHLKESESKVYPFDNTTVFLGQHQGQIMCSERGTGIKVFRNGQFELLENSNILKDTDITSFLSLSADTLLLSTLRNGLFYLTKDELAPWLIKDQNYVKEQQIESTALLADNGIAIGTNTGGILIINRQRQSTQLITKKEGLQNNTVNTIFLDQMKNIWLGLHNGIDYILTNSPFSTFYPNQDLESASFTVKIHNGFIYIGTAEGLYYSDWKTHYDPFTRNQDFALVNNTKGEVRGLQIIDNHLFLAHNDGAFIVEGSTAVKISPKEGTWIFSPLQDDEDYIVSGTYYGLSLYKKENGNWRYLYQLEGLEESCRVITQSASGEIWVSHPYRGVFRIVLDAEKRKLKVDYPGTIPGLPSNLNNYVCRFYDKIIVGAEKGVYAYNEPNNRFELYNELNQRLGPENILRGVFPDEAENVWYVSRDETGFLKFKDEGFDKKVEKLVFPELHKKLVGGFEYIYSFNEENVFFGAEKGVIHFNPQKVSSDSLNFNVQINKIYAISTGDSLIFGGNGALENRPTFQNKMNAFRYHFSGVAFEHWNNIKYSTYLEGLDEKWSSWTDQTVKDYTNLPAGNFVFKVKAQNARGQESNIAEFPFTIRPPWYATYVAYLIYSLFIIGIILSLILIPRRKFKKETALLKSENDRIIKVHEEQLVATGKEIMQLKNEKLEAEVEHKNQELASATMHLVQKNGLLNNLNKELKSIRQKTDNQEIRKKLNSLVRILEHDTNLDEDWEQFAFRFDQVHGDFFKRLKSRYPKLTTKDHRLCAYLRLNLSSKEIAPLMNISVRGVEISRYRLRKKLDLDTNINLTEFLMNF
jgi:ligand-binding sensor domain-containing protein/DNA-binding CsgD family transcriptional regulator